MIEIYTDGGCSGNPGPGGWAYVLTDGGRQVKASGGEADTTNNKMELTAVIEALEAVKADKKTSLQPVTIVTDSQYVKSGITTWIHNWVKNGWKTAAKKPVKNQEYWMRLKALCDELDVNWKWVKGHSGNELNEECDSMVGAEMDKFRSAAQ
jgi:ribonuclease HI